MLVGVVLAVAAGVAFAVAGVLQQWVASSAPRPSVSVRLLATLGRRPLWLAGIGLAAAGNGLQALALALAPLALVQPLLVTELVFAIPISARLHRTSLGPREWTGIAAVSVGLAGTVWGASPHGTGGNGTALRWAIAGGGVAFLAVVLAAAGRRRGRSVTRASLLAAAAALVFALYSTLLAATVAEFASRRFGALLTPTPYVMTLASLAGLVLIQSAFQAGPLAVSMPMVDWVQPLVAVLLAISVLGESLNTGTVHMVVLGGGAVTALAGILALDTSPQVRTMQQATTKPVETRDGTAQSPAHGRSAAAHTCECRASRRGMLVRRRVLDLLTTVQHHGQS